MLGLEPQATHILGNELYPQPNTFFFIFQNEFYQGNSWSINKWKANTSTVYAVIIKCLLWRWLTRKVNGILQSENVIL